jgi:hypothetical protein
MEICLYIGGDCRHSQFHQGHPFDLEHFFAGSIDFLSDSGSPGISIFDGNFKRRERNIVEDAGMGNRRTAGINPQGAVFLLKDSYAGGILLKISGV